MRGAAGVRRALQGPGVPAVGAEAWAMDWLGPGNTNVGTWEGGWVVPLPWYHPPRTTPGTPPPADMLVPGTNTVYGTLGTCTYDRFKGPVGDPRG